MGNLITLNIDIIFSENVLIELGEKNITLEPTSTLSANITGDIKDIKAFLIENEYDYELDLYAKKLA